jgi:hypothetical protein
MEPEEKFKVSLLNLEKKILDLESIVSELSERMKGIDVSEVKERIEEIEDLVMVSNLAIIDLKKKVEEWKGVDEKTLKKLVESTQQATVEELKKEMKKTRENLEAIRKEAGLLQKSMEEMKKLPTTELKEKIAILENNFKNVVKEFEELKHTHSDLSFTLQKIKRDVASLGEKDIKKILTEITAIRNEFSKEVREIREQVENISEKTSGVDLAILSSKFNTLKENVDYLLNRKVETDMKLRTLEETLTKVVSGGEVMPQNILKSMEKISEKLKTLEGGLNYLKTTIIDEIGGKVGEIEKRLRMVEIASPETATPIVEESIKLFAKVRDIENRLKILEATPVKPTAEIGLSGIMRKIEEVEKNIRLDLISVSNLFESKIAEIENKIKELEEKVKLQAIVPKMDEKLMSLLTKISDLEGRIAAIEKLKVSTTKTPIILE